MKATRLAFAAALVAASLVSGSAREFYNARLDGGERSMPDVHPASPRVGWKNLGGETSTIRGELIAHVTVNKNGRATKVVLDGTSGRDSHDYTITRVLRKARYEKPADGQEHTAVITVAY